MKLPFVSQLLITTLVVGAFAPTLEGAKITTKTYGGSFPGTVAGALANEDTVLELALTLPSGDFAAWTSSYATGGFQPSLELFNSAGKFLDASGATAPPNASRDPKTKATLDAYLKATGLSAGRYTLTISDWELQQSPTATNLASGFTFNLGNGTTFTDAIGTDRDGNFTLALSTSGTSTVPEPSIRVLILVPLVGLVLLSRRWIWNSKQLN